MGNEVKTLKESIQKEFLNSAFDLSQEYAEIGLDQLLDNQAFKEIPVVKTIVGTIKGVLAIRELVFARKLAVFFQQFHKGLQSQQDTEIVINYLIDDSKRRDKIIEQVIVMNERYVVTKQSVIHANLLVAHLKLKLTFEELSDLLICLDALHPKSIDFLSDLASRRFVFTVGYSSPWGESLVAVGLTSRRGPSTINNLGRKLYYYGIEGDFDAVIPISNEITFL